MVLKKNVCKRARELRVVTLIYLHLQGIGPKVANCVCLVSLDKMDAIPVDTHVRQIGIVRNRHLLNNFEGNRVLTCFFSLQHSDLCLE